MMPTTRMALSLPAPTGSVADTLELAREAEAMGYEDLWLADAGGLDAFTLAPMLLEATERARVVSRLCRPIHARRR